MTTISSIIIALVNAFLALTTAWKIRVSAALLVFAVGAFWFVLDWALGDFWGGLSSLLAAWGCSALFLGFFVDGKSTVLAVIMGWAFGAASVLATLGHPALSTDVQREAVKSFTFLQDVANGQGDFANVPYGIQRQAGDLLSNGVCGAPMDPGLGINLASRFSAVLYMGPEATVLARFAGFPAVIPQHRCIGAKSKILKQISTL